MFVVARSVPVVQGRWVRRESARCETVHSLRMWGVVSSFAPFQLHARAVAPRGSVTEEALYGPEYLQTTGASRQDGVRSYSAGNLALCCVFRALGLVGWADLRSMAPLAPPAF